MNRGGLFLISDSVYELFRCTETVLCQYLPRLSTNHGINIEEVINFIFNATMATHSGCSRCLLNGVL